MKLFTCDEFDSAVSIAELQRENADMNSDEMCEFVTKLNMLCVNESAKFNFGAGGIFTFKRIQ